jgi:hypothetical protein
MLCCAHVLENVPPSKGNTEAECCAVCVVLCCAVLCQGPAPALQSYLNIDAIVDAAKKTGARAVSDAAIRTQACVT